MFGVSPGGPHLVNLLLHAINVVLLFWVLQQATGFLGRSFMAAALFAVHPLNVETVAWIAERKTVLSTVFFLLALGAYRWYVSKPRWTRYMVVAGLFGIGLMCKPQIITLPCVLLLWDYWPLQRMFAPRPIFGEPDEPPAFPGRSFFFLVKEKLPLFLICLVSAGITMKVQHVARVKYWPYTMPVRIENALVAYARYVGKALWPSKLALFYPHPGTLLPLAQVAVAALFLLTVTALVVVFRRHRYLPVGWFWFLGMLVPMIGVIQVGRQAMADRYAYNSFVGLFIMVCWGMGALAARKRVPAAALAGASLAAVLALAIVARRQIDLWGDNEALWSHTAEVTSGNWVAEELLAEMLAEDGRVLEAMPHFYHVNALHPTDWMANMGIGIYEHRLHHPAESIPHLQAVIKAGAEAKRESRIQAYDYMAADYLSLGDSSRAAACRKAAATLLRNPTGTNLEPSRRTGSTNAMAAGLAGIPPRRHSSCHKCSHSGTT